MKGLQKFAALCTSVVLGVCGMGSVLAQPLTADAATESTVPEGFVYVDGTHFMCDGEPFYFAGCNSYDMFTLGDGSSNDSTEAIETKFMNKEAIDARMKTMAFGFCEHGAFPMKHGMVLNSHRANTMKQNLCCSTISCILPSSTISV